MNSLGVEIGWANAEGDLDAQFLAIALDGEGHGIARLMIEDDQVDEVVVLVNRDAIDRGNDIAFLQAGQVVAEPR